MKPSKRHHFISQFYLAGFTSNGAQDGDIYCFDLHKKCHRPTKTKDIAFENHFNDIDLPGILVDELESNLSSIEGEISPVFTQLRDTKRLPQGIEFGMILNFIALVLVRNPAVRRAVDKARTQAYFSYLQSQLSTKESWEKLKAETQSSGMTLLADFSYEDALEKLLEPVIRIQGEPMSFHEIEFETVNEVLPLLASRMWELVSPPPDKFFITSDRPVSTIWTSPWPPPLSVHGLKSQHSALLFPVSAGLLLLGTLLQDKYSSNPALRNPPMVNNLIMTQCEKFVYSSEPSFLILNERQQVYSSDKYFTKGAP